MKLDSLESALETQKMLIAKHEQLEDELNKIKRGILEVNKIIRQHRQVQSPFILAFEFLNDIENNLTKNFSYSYETEDKLQEELKSYKSMFEKTESFTYFIFKYHVLKDNTEGYEVIEVGKNILESSTTGLYRLLHQFVHKENDISSQKLFPLPIDKKIINEVDVHINLIELIENIKKIQNTDSPEMLRAFSDGDIPYIKKFLEDILTDKITINIINNATNEERIKDSKFMNIDEVSKVFSIYMQLNI